MNLHAVIAKELNIQEKQVADTVALIDEGNTIPFIARYRKEITGGLDDAVLRDLEERLGYLRNLQAKKEEVKRKIDATGQLTDELTEKIDAASVLQEVEDLYLPFKPKRRTRAIMAREKGLTPLADMLLAQEADEEDILSAAEALVSEKKCPHRRMPCRVPWTYWPNSLPKRQKFAISCVQLPKNTGRYPLKKPKGRKIKPMKCTSIFPKPYIPCRPIGCWPCFGEKKKAR